MRIAVVVLCTTLTVAALFVAGCSSSSTRFDRMLEDPEGDVAATTGPDVVAVTVERENETITFRVRFASAPPLEMNHEVGWIDMLLIGIDVPPLGPPPAAPGGEWRGADYVLGTHGPLETGSLVRLTARAPDDQASSEKQGDISIDTEGTTLSLHVSREQLGNPGTFAVSIAAAREWNESADEPAGAAPDVVPDAGTWIVELDT